MGSRLPILRQAPWEWHHSCSNLLHMALERPLWWKKYVNEAPHMRYERSTWSPVLVAPPCLPHLGSRLLSNLRCYAKLLAPLTGIYTVRPNNDPLHKTTL